MIIYTPLIMAPSIMNFDNDTESGTDVNASSRKSRCDLDAVNYLLKRVPSLAYGGTRIIK